MSAWQSFFNQLLKPVKNQNIAIHDHVCQCDEGSLVIDDKKLFIQNKNCSTEKFCCILQMDKFKAQTSGNGIMIGSVENYKEGRIQYSPKSSVNLYFEE
ncbi:MAG: hypothetical protein ACXAB2_11930 [Candidatus Hodarchaeales archaeon]|jgi:hypothetical protein